MGSKNMFSKCNFQRSFCLKLQGPELSYLVYSIIYRSSTEVVQIIPLGSKLTPHRGHNFTLNYIRKASNDFFSWTANGWSPTKVVQIVPVGCISRSQCQEIGFQNAIFKNLLVWNYKAQSFHIWYIASSRGPLPKLFKLCPWGQNWPRPSGQNWPRPGGHNFTLNDIRKTLNDFFSWTANGNLTKLSRNDPWVVTYQNYSNLTCILTHSDSLTQSRIYLSSAAGIPHSGVDSRWLECLTFDLQETLLSGSTSAGLYDLRSAFIQSDQVFLGCPRLPGHGNLILVTLLIHAMDQMTIPSETSGTESIYHSLNP